MEKSYRNDKKFGVTSALLSGISWGLDTTIVGVILAMGPYVSTPRAIIVAPIVGAFLHDSFSAIWMTILAIFKKDLARIISLFKTRSGRFVVLGGLFGGPVGMMAYLYAIGNIGPGYTAAITAMYPAVGAVLSTIFLKVKLSKFGWLGLAISICSVIILGYEPTSGQAGNFFLGFLAALLTVLGWALESVICAYGMKDDIKPEEALTIRQITSAFVYLLIVVFLIKEGPMALSIVKTNVGLYTGLTALVGTLSYIFYYRGIDSIGPIKATGLNITYSIWAILFSMLIIGGRPSFKLVFCAAMIIVGTIIVSRDQEKYNINGN